MILLTGAAGFVGQGLVQRFTELANVQFSTTDFADTDITQRDAVFAKLESTRPSVVIHAAAITTDSSDLHLLEVNVRGTLYVLEAAKAVGVKHFIFLSSAGVYTPNNQAASEDSLTSSGSAYGLSKLLGEDLCRALKSEMTIWILRLGAVYAEIEQKSATRANVSLVRQIARAIQQNQALILPRAATDIYNWLYISDLADLLVLISNKVPDGGLHLYNVAGKPCSVTALLECFAGLVSPDPRALFSYTHNPVPRHGELLCERIFQDLGWQAQTPLEVGLQRILARGEV